MPIVNIQQCKQDLNVWKSDFVTAKTLPQNHYLISLLHSDGSGFIVAQLTTTCDKNGSCKTKHLQKNGRPRDYPQLPRETVALCRIPGASMPAPRSQTLPCLTLQVASLGHCRRGGRRHLIRIPCRSAVVRGLYKLEGKPCNQRAFWLSNNSNNCSSMQPVLV